MRKCIVCKKDLEHNEEDICRTCFAFFEWKYKNQRKHSLNHLRKYSKKKEKSSGGRKK